MTKEVLISITGLQQEISDEEPVEIISVGEYYYRNGKHYIMYEDMLVDDQLSKNIIKIAPNQVDISKKGAASVQMVFEVNKKNATMYATPFGELSIGIFTTKMELQEEENCINLDLEYSLDMNYNHLSDCSIQLSVKPLPKAE